VFDLVKQIGDGRAIDLDASVELSFDMAEVDVRPGGASPKVGPVTWREYYGFLRGLRLAEATAGKLDLTPAGLELLSHPTAECLSEIMADRIRLFAEVLLIIAAEPRTVDEVDIQIRERFGQSWRSKGSTRSRMDWQEVLGLIEAVGNRRWQVTPRGRDLLDGRLVVTPESFLDEKEQIPNLPAVPADIAALLEELAASDRGHEARSTYNIWVPSPVSAPNKVDNLRTIINAALERIEREELFSFICSTFDLKRSSVDSMLPFMRAAGILSEIGRGVFQATPAARAWIESGEDINFIRILHANFRFVGEMIQAVENDVTRNAMYAEAALFGLNVDKSRWIASFLLNTGLIEEPRYGSLKATARGLALAAQLPLADKPVATSRPVTQVEADHPDERELRGLKDRLTRLSREPLGDGQVPGRAFEIAVRDAFLELRFNARVIGGTGEPDVVVQWRDSDGSTLKAVIEAKSRSVGHVTHSDVSDVAIETHKGRYRACCAAVIGPGFSGPTIKDMAIQRHWALLDAEHFGTLVEESVELGLRPCEVATLFQTPDGVVDLEKLIASRRRELDVVSYLFSKLVEESGESGEAITARDISRDGRQSELRPTVDEVVAAIGTITRLQIGALRQVEASGDPKFSTYVLDDAHAGASQLRAIADAIDSGIGGV